MVKEETKNKDFRVKLKGTKSKWPVKKTIKLTNKKYAKWA